MSVESIAAIKNDNRLITPVQALRQAADEIESGERVCGKLLILTLNDEDDEYDDGFYAVNLKISEMISLCHIVCQRFYRILLE